MEKYLVIMDRALAAYPPDRMTDWFRKVQKTGVTEHGFPRLTANLGILIAHGLHTDLLPLFTEMMTFVCRDIRHGHCANDFSVRELLCALREIRGSGLVPPDVIEGWRADLAALRAPGCDDKTAKDAFTRNHNWGCFAAASEYLRQAEGLCDASGFLNVELPSQLLNFDENGMYRDPHCPMVYDIVPRAQLCVLLKFGYRGHRADAIRALCLAECPGETLVLPVPVFVTDGAEEARSTVRDGTLTVCFAGHTYTVFTDNALARAPQTLCNRNGLYGLCKITGKDKITAKFTLE